MVHVTMMKHSHWVILLAAFAGCGEPTSGPTKGSSSTGASATGGAPPPSGSAAGSAARVELPPAPPLPANPPFFPDVPVPDDNKLTAEKVELGKMLFFDKRLGKDDKFSCESCHYVDKGWADGEKLSIKADGKSNTRHSPTLWNAAYAKEFYWDGRSATLEVQVLAAWKGQIGGDPAKVAEKLNAIPVYKAHFQRAFGADASEQTIVQALASFVRTIRAGDTPWDKYEGGDKKAVDEAAVRGFEVFTKKANCSLCHAPPLYSDYLFHNVGIGFGEGVTEPDVGRGKVSNKPEDKGRFKTPSLRGVATHPPYFHDGSAATLEEAVDYMLSGGHKNDNLDQQLKKIDLSQEERADLLAFLKALSPADYKFDPPKLP
jgi:cytochrome c peroxidase